MAGMQKRNTGPMMESSSYGPKTRKGRLYRSPAVAGKARCRMHGGATASGAPIGNKNALKHGWYTAEFREMRREVNQVLVRRVGDAEATQVMAPL